MKQTVQQFTERHKISITSEYAEENQDIDIESAQNMNHYKCILKRPDKRMIVYFSQGRGIEGAPTVNGVLDCLASDSAGIGNAVDFEGWADDYGYDRDNRKAYEIYKTYKRQATALCKFLGNDLYNELLWSTARE